MTTEYEWQNKIRPSMCLGCGDIAADIIKERDEAIRRLKDRERSLGADLHIARVRCNQKLNRDEVMEELRNFALAVLAGKYLPNSTGADHYLKDTGWRTDDGRDQDTEKTVGPIRDVGNPFETAIPY